MKPSFKITLEGVEGRVVPESKMLELNLIALDYKDMAEITHRIRASSEICDRVTIETFEFDFVDMQIMLEFAKELKNL